MKTTRKIIVSSHSLVSVLALVAAWAASAPQARAAVSQSAHGADADSRQSAQQATTTSEPENTTTAEATASSGTGLPFGFQLMSFLYGPMMGDPGSGEVPTTWMNQTAGVSVQNQLGIRYDFSDNFSITPTFDFEWLVTDPNHQYGDQYVALSYDSFIKAAVGNIASFDLGEHTLSIYGDFRYYLPTSEYSRDNNSLGSMRATLIPSIQFAHSDWSLAFVNFVRYFIERQDFETYNRQAALPRVMYYTGPLVNYAVSDKLGLWLLGEASVTYDTKGHANTAQPDRTLVDLEPGMDIRVNKNITLSPYLNWFIRQPIDTTSINLTANISI